MMPGFGRIALSGSVPAAIAAATPLAAQEAAGDWVGPLEVAPGTRIPLVVHIERDDAGTLGGTMDSPAQGVRALPLVEIVAEAGSLAFTVPAIGGSYSGQWDAEAGRWQGEWSQGGIRRPLALFNPPPRRPLPTAWELPSDAEIASLIADRNAPRAGQGIVVGVLSPDGERIVAGGTGAGSAVDRNTLFEIGSISKVFTALILVDMANKGEVSLDDPAAKYLPAGHRMPDWNGGQITLRDLSTHHSGLPRMADDMGRADGIDDPFAGYGEDELLAFLARTQLTRDVGTRWEYSNVAVGLLGYLLGRAAGTDFETLLRERVTGPLDMSDTLIALPPSHRSRLASPFGRYMEPAKPWDMDLFAPAGGIRSSAADMLKFAAAVVDPDSPIAAAVKTTLAVRVPTSSAEGEQALGWEIAHPGPDREVLAHAGQTGGYRAMLALEPAKGRAVIAFSNSAAEPSTVDLALHVLIGAPVVATLPVPPAPPPPTVHTEIAMQPAELDKFIGRYRFDFGVVAITREGAMLRAHRADTAGAQAMQIFPEAPLAFFWKAVDAQIRFTTDSQGAVTGAELTQGGQSFTAKRVMP